MTEDALAADRAFPWQQCPLFNYCDAQDWDRLQGFVESREEPKGNTIWTEGDPDSHGLILLKSGSMELFCRTPGWAKPIILAEFGPGSALGALPPANQEPHSATLLVVADASYWLLSGARATELLAQFPQTGDRLRQGIFLQERRRLRSANHRLAALF